MQWLSFLSYFVWNSLSYAANKATASVGFSIASILAVLKTNTNQTLMLAMLATMCAMMIGALLYLCKLLKDAYIEIGKVITDGNHSLYSIIVPLIKLVMFSYMFFPVVYLMISVISFYPAIVLYVAGYQKEANFYLKEIMEKNPYGH